MRPGSGEARKFLASAGEYSWRRLAAAAAWSRRGPSSSSRQSKSVSAPESSGSPPASASASSPYSTSPSTAHGGGPSKRRIASAAASGSPRAASSDARIALLRASTLDPSASASMPNQPDILRMPSALADAKPSLARRSATVPEESLPKNSHSSW